MAGVIERFDRKAVLDGALLALAVCVPLQALAAVIVEEDERSGWTSLLALATFLGLVAGAALAARNQRRDTPISHGIVTATGVFVCVQFVLSVLKALRGDEIRWDRISASFALTMLAGVLGGFIGSAMARRRDEVTGKRGVA